MFECSSRPHCQRRQAQKIRRGRSPVRSKCLGKRCEKVADYEAVIETMETAFEVFECSRIAQGIKEAGLRRLRDRVLRFHRRRRHCGPREKEGVVVSGQTARMFEARTFEARMFEARFFETGRRPFGARTACRDTGFRNPVWTPSTLVHPVHRSRWRTPSILARTA